MRRAALAVLLTFFVPILLVAQRHAAEGGSGSSGGYSGSSGSSSSNVSSSTSSSNSGSSHSSSTSSGSSGYSGGSSGNSGGNRGSDSSSGVNHGASHTSGGASSSPSTHSGSSASGSGNADAGTHAGLASGSARSNLREAGSDSRTSGRQNPSALFGPSSQLASAGVNDESLQKPVTFHLFSAGSANPQKALRNGSFDAELQMLGVEKTKTAYEQKTASTVEKSAERKEHSWAAKFLLGRGSTPEANPELRPCKLKECKPIPGPPKPVQPPHPTPPPVSAGNVCLSGVPDPLNAYQCLPWGYINNCNRSQGCYLHLAPVDYSYCDEILRRLREAEKAAEGLEKDEKATCSANPQSMQCAMATGDHQTAKDNVLQLSRQYQMCRMAAVPTTSNNWPRWPLVP